jgi:hypothetical protein
MADIFEQSLKQLNKFSDKASRKMESLFKLAVDKGGVYANKGKIQIEIEKLKWELKQLYVELGRYTALKHRENGTLDFSHDERFVILIDKIENQRKYIEDRLKSKDEGNTKNASDEDVLKLS